MLPFTSAREAMVAVERAKGCERSTKPSLFFGRNWKRGHLQTGRAKGRSDPRKRERTFWVMQVNLGGRASEFADRSVGHW
jgi:hypothetical protein